MYGFREINEKQITPIAGSQEVIPENRTFVCLLGDDIPLIIHYASLQKPFLHLWQNSVPPVNKTHLNKLNWEPVYIRTKPNPAPLPYVMKVFTEAITLVLWGSHNAQCNSNSLPSKHKYIFIVWHAVKWFNRHS